MRNLAVLQLAWVYLVYVGLHHSVVHRALVLYRVRHLLEELPVADGVAVDQQDLLLAVHTQLCSNGFVLEDDSRAQLQEVGNLLRETCTCGSIAGS